MTPAALADWEADLRPLTVPGANPMAWVPRYEKEHLDSTQYVQKAPCIAG